MAKTKTSYAETLKKKLKDDIAPPAVLPDCTVELKIVGKGRIRENRSDNEKAPSALISYSVRAVAVIEADDDEMEEAAQTQGYKSVTEMLQRWKGFAEFEIWEPKEDQTDDEVIDAVRSKISRVLGKQELRAVSLEDVLNTVEGSHLIGTIARIETDDGYRNYSIGSRNLAPVVES